MAELDAWREQIQWMLPRTHPLKVSEEDLELADPGLGLRVFAAQALAKGVAWVVVSRGGRGAVAWTTSGEVEIGPLAIDVIDTVGAGDTFQAALLTWPAKNDSLAAKSLSSLPIDTLRSALNFAARASPHATRPCPPI